MNTIRVILADDHQLVRAGIRALLQNIPNIEVVGEAADGRDALALAVEHHPDVLLLDITMKGMNGLEALTRLTKEAPDVRVLVLSMHTDHAYVVQALRSGAAGYVLKNSAPSELDIAIRAVMNGDNYLSPSISKHVIHQYLASDSPTRTPSNELTPRQREILQLVAEGQSTKDIASRLNLSVKTIETYRAQLMERLHIHDVPGLVRYAIRTGLVSVES
jgi:DNA-binding NarL/FixJ family response regulator